jgi:hypothetical protein
MVECLLGKKRVSASDDLENYRLDNCPHCEAPIEPSVKFCMNCQHHLVSPIELAKLRASQGIYSLPKGHRGGAGSNRGFSKRAKKTTTVSPTLGIQKLLTLVLILALVYGGYAASQNKRVMRSLNHMVTVLNSSR